MYTIVNIQTYSTKDGDHNFIIISMKKQCLYNTYDELYCVYALYVEETRW